MGIVPPENLSDYKHEMNILTYLYAGYDINDP